MATEPIKEKILVSVSTYGELYDGKEEVGVELEINYVEKSYEITTPYIRVETSCNFAIHVANAIIEATKIAQEKLFKQ